MLPEEIRNFVAENHHGVLTTFRKNGAAQMSIVSCGPFREGVAFTTTTDRAKLANLRRDSRCSMLVSQPDWWGYLVLEGSADLLSSDNTDAEELRRALRDVYKTVAGREHPDWEEYDQAMRDEHRVVVIVLQERVYGTKA